MEEKTEKELVIEYEKINHREAELKAQIAGLEVERSAIRIALAELREPL